MPGIRGLGGRLPRVDERLSLMGIGIVAGVGAGLAAVALTRSILALEHLLDGTRAGWWTFVLPGLGAAASVLFLRHVMREDAGHGVPEVIFSVSRLGGRLHRRSAVSRLVSSCLTIGTGGSAGPEAPVVMSGAAIGSNVGRFFGLGERQRVVLVGCGAAGAIASIFNAPIAGMVFSMEVILGAWSRVNIAPIAIASVAGAEVSRLLNGNQIPFGPARFSIDLADIVASVGLAVVAAAASLLLTRSLRASHELWERAPLPAPARALAGGAVVGVIGLALPVVLGEGYHAVRAAIEGTFEPGLALVAVAVLAKIVATSTTIGSGGSGGVFAPSLVVGSLLGLAYYRGLTWLLPGVDIVPEGCFALLGMAGLLAGLLQAPLTAIFLIVEITGGWSVILPLIVVSVVSATVCGRLEPASFYLRDLVARGQLLRPGTDARVLADLTAEELLERDAVRVTEDMRLRDLVEIVKHSHRNYFPVEDRDRRRFVGMVHLDDVREVLFTPELYDAVLVADLMNPSPATVAPDDSLAEVLERMEILRVFSLPVVEDGGFRGMVSKATILDQYRKELNVQSEE